MQQDLPINEVLPQIGQAMRAGRRLVLAAPPGAGKTTRVPLFLAGLAGETACITGKILLLEPRRVAARMAAQFMAESLGEPVGKTIGLSTRIDRKVSSETRIEVITDGLFTRRILSDPELSGIGGVIFDEFHERRLNMDLGLALVLETQAAFRDDLSVILMSATLDTEAVSKAIQAPVIQSEGRAYPVETVYLGRSDQRIEERMASAIRTALRKQDGSVLAFLPGAGEINRTAERLETLGEDVLVAPLYGALSPQKQDAAVSACREGQRKIVLATDIAESALTIDGVRIVIDSGLARVAEDATGGMGQKLRTVTASRASVDQRRGRAGRTQSGVCYRLWDEAATRGLPAAPQPEILTSDLAGLVLALAEWGERDPGKLIWMTPPPVGKVKAAQALLTSLGALDTEGAITPLGTAMSALPLSPRLAALVAGCEDKNERALAAEVAALAGERGVGGNSTDIRDRLSRFRAERSPRARVLQKQAARWGGGADPRGDVGQILARAFPDQMARKRAGGGATYLMASGRAARLEETDSLARSEWLMVLDLGGASKEARISLAVPLSEADALRINPPVTKDTAELDTQSGRFTARRVKAIGAIVLSEVPLPKPDGKVAADAMLQAVASTGWDAIGVGAEIAETCARLKILSDAGLLSGQGEDVALTPESVIGNAADWLRPLLVKGGASLPPAPKVREALIQSLEWTVQEALRNEAPLSLVLASGQSARIDYLDARAPLVSARAQAFYGVDRHPALAGGRVPVTVELLSPGMKPAATTQDLPAFWKAGYKDMAKDMRGRYPKHDWPDDPATARPHEGRTKKRL